MAAKINGAPRPWTYNLEGNQALFSKYNQVINAVPNGQQIAANDTLSSDVKKPSRPKQENVGDGMLLKVKPIGPKPLQKLSSSYRTKAPGSTKVR
jgi:hypothetical protein